MSKRLNNVLKVVLFSILAFSLILCVFTLNTNKNTVSAASDSVIIKDTASIRYDEPTGIRFTAYVSDALFADAEDHVLNADVTVGMKVYPEKYASNPVTVKSGDAGFVWNANSEKDGYQQFTVVLKDIPQTYYGEKIFASAFSQTGAENPVATQEISYSISEVATTVLAANQLEDEKLDADRVTALEAYVANATALDKVTVKVLDGKASWEAVANASGYLVKTANGIIRTTETEIDLTTETKVSVVAYGDGETYTYSDVAEKAVHALTEMQLATFDDVSYFEDLIPGNPNFDPASTMTNVSTFGTSFPYETGKITPAFVENFEDKNGVVAEKSVLISVGITSYIASMQRHAPFTVQLQKGLNLTDYDGIKVRINIENCTNESNEHWLYLGGQDIYQGYLRSASNKTSVPGYDSIASTQVVGVNTWMDWYISADDLKTYYQDGDNQITLIVYHRTGVSQNGNRYNVYIDDISYYEQLDTPTNLTIDGNTLTWNAVANAESYVVKVGETEIPVSTNNVDLSAYLSSDTIVYVKAVANGFVDSTFASKAVMVLTGNQMATFNSEAYVDTISSITNTQGNNGAKVFSVAYVDGATAGTDSGVLDIALRPNNWRQADFKVTFANPIDLTNADGIAVRIKLYDASYYSGFDTSKMIFKALTKSGGNYTDGKITGYSTAITLGEWITVKFAKADIEKCILDDGKSISFCMHYNGDISATANYVKLYLDDISYYDN